MQRTVPTPLLRQGILQFKDAAGNTEQINLATATICGPSGNLPCDPRGLGMSPAVKAQWALLPLPNLPGGDGLNTGSYLANIPTPISTNYGVLRLDHNFTDKLQFNGSYTIYDLAQAGSGDIAIASGQPHSVVQTPDHPHLRPAHVADSAQPAERPALGRGEG